MSNDIPDKYRGKELSDIIKMHQEAEKLIGKAGSRGWVKYAN
jgi:hypothetical protein